MEELASASADMYPPRTSQVWRTLLNRISLLFQIFVQIIRGAPSVLSYVGLRHPSLLSSTSLQFKQLPDVELQEPEEASTFSSSIRISSGPVSDHQKLEKLTVVLDLDETLVCAYETSTVPAFLLKQATEAGLNCFELECISSEKESEVEPKVNYVTVFERPGLHDFLKVLNN